VYQSNEAGSAGARTIGAATTRVQRHHVTDDRRTGLSRVFLDERA